MILKVGIRTGTNDTSINKTKIIWSYFPRCISLDVLGVDTYEFKNSYINQYTVYKTWNVKQEKITIDGEDGLRYFANLIRLFLDTNNKSIVEVLVNPDAAFIYICDDDGKTIDRIYF